MTHYGLILLSMRHTWLALLPFKHQSATFRRLKFTLKPPNSITHGEFSCAATFERPFRSPPFGIFLCHMHIRDPPHAHLICFRAITIPFICDLKIDRIMSSFLQTSSIVHMFDFDI